MIATSGVCGAGAAPPANARASGNNSDFKLKFPARIEYATITLTHFKQADEFQMNRGTP
jgi:hypothetical protein